MFQKKGPFETGRYLDLNVDFTVKSSSKSKRESERNNNAICVFPSRLHDDSYSFGRIRGDETNDDECHQHSPGQKNNLLYMMQYIKVIILVKYQQLLI